MFLKFVEALIIVKINYYIFFPLNYNENAYSYLKRDTIKINLPRIQYRKNLF